MTVVFLMKVTLSGLSNTARRNACFLKMAKHDICAIWPVTLTDEKWVLENGELPVPPWPV